jgi:phosphoglycerol transferase MdoB-like AlkP superfamily enzyme
MIEMTKDRFFTPPLVYYVYFLCIYAWFAWVYAVYSTSAGIGILDSPGNWLIPLVEVIFCCWLGRCFAPQRRSRWSWLCYSFYFGLPLLLALIYIAQGFSLYLSNNYLTVLALENSAERRLTNSPLLNSVLAGFIGVWVGLIIVHRVLKQSAQPIKARRTTPILLMLVCVGSITYTSLNAGETGWLAIQENESPVISLTNTLALTAARKISDYRAALDVFNRPAYMADSEPFPFQKKFAFNSKIPFERLSTNGIRPNVIVIFAEGFSARFISAYGGARTDLTPNTDKLAHRTLQVDNYFNHTAATHRGLQGFLVSAYPAAGGAEEGTGWEEGDNAKVLAKIHYKTLTRTLKDKGYETFFISPHPDRINLNSMLQALDFDKVYSLPSLQEEFLDGRATLTKSSVSDKDLFLSLKRFLERRKASGQDQPFFLSIYNIGTHAFLDVGEEGVKYGDGSNAVLNRMHNYDAQLEQFLSYFFASEYQRNTILVFTSDHATYPEPAMIAAVKGEEYQPYFVDRIPLLVYAPGIQLPKRYDADGRTSVDLAPTLLNLLGIQDRSNSFLGRSIFERHRLLPFGMVAIGRQFYATDKDGVHSEENMPAVYQENFLKYKAYIQQYYQLEKADRIYRASQIR